MDGVHRVSCNEHIAQNTIFGWILSNPTGFSTVAKSHSLHMHHCILIEPIDKEIPRFWEIEELPRTNHLTEEERQCENHFVWTHTRDVTGRYIVRLPFKRNPPNEWPCNLPNLPMYAPLEERSIGPIL